MRPVRPPFSSLLSLGTMPQAVVPLPTTLPAPLSASPLRHSRPAGLTHHDLAADLSGSAPRPAHPAGRRPGSRPRPVTAAPTTALVDHVAGRRGPTVVAASAVHLAAVAPPVPVHVRDRARRYRPWRPASPVRALRPVQLTDCSQARGGRLVGLAEDDGRRVANPVPRSRISCRRFSQGGLARRPGPWDVFSSPSTLYRPRSRPVGQPLGRVVGRAYTTERLIEMKAFSGSPAASARTNAA